MDIGFNSLKELYDRVYPALKSKVRELKRNNIDYINEIDVWNALINKKWKKEKGLLLSDIVDDILNIENQLIDDYVKEEIKKSERKVDLESEII
ncbi:MAG: post-transcriptional regulator [bacterium]|nr:post-transcriptional regulator [bacterium]